MSALTRAERELLRPVSGCCIGCHHHDQPGANDEAWNDVCDVVDQILAARDAWK